jgi:hypothetical protein
METVTMGVLGIIILANIVGILAVLRVGSQPDPHQQVASLESSQALARIHADYKLLEPAAERALPASAETAGE